MSSSIYQELWDIDQQHNGCSVSSRNSNGAWNDPDADIRLDEQRELDSQSGDNSPDPLFAAVNDEKLNGPTYTALKKLMNNYVFNARSSEDHLGENLVEDSEREAFLDTILETQVMLRAYSYATSALGEDLSFGEFRNHVRKLWFEIYTNYYNNTPVAYCSGFEHIMVGESKGNPAKQGIGGYHCWIKYFWDQQSGRVDFHGYNYDNQLSRLSPQGAAVPHVATISMTYEPLDMDGTPMARKRKDMGGFFVGPSPELLMAMPVVASFESDNNMFFIGSGSTPREQTEKEVEIHDAVYRLVLYRETLIGQGRGERLRSFFPKFIRLKSGSPGDQEPVPADLQGKLAITRMLANPVNPEEGKEWVELENRDVRILQLDGWSLCDHADRVERLEFDIKPGKRRRISIPRTSPHGIQLTNSGGSIRVLDSSGELVSKVSYPRSGDGEILVFS